MKKITVKIFGSTIFLLIILFLYLLTLKGRYYSLLLSWSVSRPDIYYMEVRTTENYQDSYFAIVVENDKAIKVEFIEGIGKDPWLSKYGYTIDAILESGRDFCFPLFECLIRVDNTYGYPTILAFEGQGIVVRNFQPCESVDECMNIR